jgi:7-cyano-7-deazaguanine synthase in queuosine biosynthesis
MKTIAKINMIKCTYGQRKREKNVQVAQLLAVHINNLSMIKGGN